MALGQFQDAGFPGMKSTSVYDNVITLPAGVQIPAGRVVHRDSTGKAILPTGGTVAGAAVHDQLKPVYQIGDPVSTMTRGRLFLKVTAAGAVTNDGPVKYAADGTVGNAGAFTLPHSKFVSDLLTTTDGELYAEVELHAAFVVTAAA